MSSLTYYSNLSLPGVKLPEQGANVTTVYCKLFIAFIPFKYSYCEYEKPGYEATFQLGVVSQQDYFLNLLGCLYVKSGI